MDSNNSTKSGSLPGWKWTGAEALHWVHELNGRCLEAIAKRLARTTETRGGDAVAMFKADIDLWLKLDEAAQRRASRCPYLLVGMRLDDAPWWEEAKREAMKPASSSVFFSAATAGLGRALASDVLMLAWFTARADQRTATLLFGMDPRVALVIASLSPVEVRRISTRIGNQLRPRWENNQRIWRDLLIAATSADESALTDIHLYGIQLLGTDLLNVSEVS